MSETNKSVPYTISGVIQGLHYQKLGQYRSRQKASFVVAAISLLAISMFLLTSSPGHTPGVSTIYFGGGGGDTKLKGRQTISYPKSRRRVNRPRSSDFPIGYIGQYTITRDFVAPPSPSAKSREMEIWYPAPEIDGQVTDGVLSLQPMGDGDLPFGWADNDFGLPDPAPMYSFTSRGLPSGIGDRQVTLPTLTRQAHAMLHNPVWPKDVWLVDDTAIVEGWLTLHSYGLMSFELISENPPGLGFSAAVKRAVERGQCIPATDSLNNRTTVRCRYRCLFFHGAESAVSVGVAVSARVRR